MKENAEVCVYTNLPSGSKGVETLPIPAEYKSKENGNRRSKKITSNPATSDSKVSSELNFVIKYPDSVDVLQNASDFARVVEPSENMSEFKIR